MFKEVNTISFKEELFPIKTPKYILIPGLRPHTDLSDTFLKDELYDDYIEQKKECRNDDVEKYYCFSEEFKEHENEVNALLKDLISKHDFNMPDNQSEYKNYFDYIASNIQEDLVVVKRINKTENKLIAIHLSAPNYWDPNDKIDQDFVKIHEPVQDMELILDRKEQMLEFMIDKGPFKRFAWGLSTDTRLNHHPTPPNGEDDSTWYGRAFDPQNPELYMRVEKQHTFGLPDSNCALFTIRTYFFDMNEVRKLPKFRDLVVKNIETMTPKTLVYKGLDKRKADIIKWLNE